MKKDRKEGMVLMRDERMIGGLFEWREGRGREGKPGELKEGGRECMTDRGKTKFGRMMMGGKVKGR